MTKNEQLNRLFDEWINKFPHYKGKFKKDGIINEDTYNEQNTKILFISKEPNDVNQEEGDYRVWWRSEVKWTFSYRIAEWAYGILKNQLPPSDINNLSKVDRIDAMKKIAFMNLKKVGGGASVNYDVLKRTIITEKDLIVKEIKIIEPDIIIGSIGQFEFWNHLFGDKLNEQTVYGCKVFRNSHYKVVHYFHPSYRVPRAMSYSLLQNIIHSEIFKKL
ncbi:MAG: hypothetical protein H6628_04915 [Calditrichae bacterium]|nr:hypothetical protein [Calditrichia bacterium]